MIILSFVTTMVVFTACFNLFTVYHTPETQPICGLNVALIVDKAIIIQSVERG